MNIESPNKAKREEKQNEISHLKNQFAVLTLHRYFIWANRMRTHFDECFKEENKSKPGNDIEQLMYMSLWYAGLYVVCAGWEKLGLTDSVIDNLIASKNLELLKIYRHGVYHFHKEYYGKCFDKLISQGENVVEWVRTLNREFGRYFLEWANQRNKTQEIIKEATP
ncbi:MAG: hypothetical protein ABIE74_04785 [Pseudomonadota bacterium]